MGEVIIEPQPGRRRRPGSYPLSVWTDRRTGNRISVTLDMRLRERYHTARPAALIDLSLGGCRITRSSLLPEQRIWVTLVGLAAIEGTAIWTSNDQSGIRFDRWLHPAVLDHIVTTHRQP